MENKIKPKVAIMFLTFNRADFAIRQLEYYAQVQCPHPIYIGDASNQENKKKVQAAVERLNKQLTINYYLQPEKFLIREARLDLHSKIKEKYCAFPGDDDYQIPDSLTLCAEFLEHNPDYSSVGGHAVSFRIADNGTYGELRRLGDYPRHQIESATAAQRLLDLMANFYLPEFSVKRTEQMPRCWASGDIKDSAFANDFMVAAVCSILGKSKIIDCLSFVKQADNPKEAPINNVFEWVTDKEWGVSFKAFCEILAKEISAIDNISLEEAIKTARQSLWIYLNVWLPYDYRKIYGAGTRNHKKPGGNLWHRVKHDILNRARRNLGQKLPWLKNIYLQISHSLPGAPPEIFYEVTRPSSPYYKDFQPVLNSFTGKYQSYSPPHLASPH